jgi:hypothetical protein
MRQSVIPLASLSLAFVFCMGGAVMAADCAPPELMNSLAMEDLPDGTMAVNATVDGNPEKLLVGIADVTQLWNTEAAKLGLPTREGRRTMDAAGRFSEDIAPVENFPMGSMKTGYFFAQVSPDPDRADGGTQGVLGNDTMQRYDIDLDFAHRQLNYFSPARCQGDGIYWTSRKITPVRMVTYASVLYVPVTLDGHTVIAALDTTADKTFLNPEVAKKLFGLTPEALKAGTVSDSGGLIKAGMHQFPNLTLGGLTFRDTEIAIPFDILTQSTQEYHANRTIRNRYPLSQILPDMVIGMDVLKQTHLYFSFQNQLVYVSSAEEGQALKPQPVKSTWFNIWSTGDPYFFYRHPFVRL